MKTYAAVAAGAVILFAGVSCSSDDTADDQATATTDEATGSGETAETEASGDGCVNDLEIVNAEASDSGIEDGPFEPEMVIVDKGPHPDNTVDYDRALEGAISGFELETDPQFGLRIPVGEPEVPDDTVFVTFSLQLPEGETISAGQSFVDQLDFEEGGEYDGEINFFAMYYGSTRELPGDPVITITEIDDEMVCGEISTVTDTDMQSFVGIAGTFVAERIQFLESRTDES